jgi:formate hydrogenlyase subunit 3/multisubunit Na+/H+ antiporter MnhD subunit
MTWTLVIFLPVIAGLLIPVPRLRDAMVAVAPWMALPALVVSLLPRVPDTETNGWLLLGSDLGVDEVTRVFLLLTALLWTLAGAYGRTYMAGAERAYRFWTFFLLTMGGNIGLVVARDVAGYYTWFALMTFAGFGLIVHDGSGEARRAGRVYIVMAIIGEAMLLSGLLLASYDAGSLATATVVENIASSRWQLPIVLLLIGGFGVKAGVIPLHLWLPLAHPVAPTPASAVLSGAMIKAGLLGWMQFLPLGNVSMPSLGTVFIFTALGSAFFAAVAGVFQGNPKTVLAYSSISQIGIISTGIGIAIIAPETWPQMAPAVAFYALHHGLAKGALFLGVGVGLAGIRSERTRLLVMAGLAIPALTLAGAPLTSGAAAKNALKEPLGIVGGQWEQWLTWLLLLAATGTTVLMARFLWLMRPRAIHDDDAHHQLTAGLWLPWTLLIVASLLSAWVVPPYLDVEAVKPVHLATPYLWQGAWPILLGLIFAWAVASLRQRGYGHRLGNIPPGDLLSILEPITVGAVGAIRSVTLPAIERQEGRMARMGDRLDVYEIIGAEFDRAEGALIRFRTAGVFFIMILVVVVLIVWRGW